MKNSLVTAEITAVKSECRSWSPCCGGGGPMIPTSLRSANRVVARAGTDFIVSTWKFPDERWLVEKTSYSIRFSRNGLPE